MPPQVRLDTEPRPRTSRAVARRALPPVLAALVIAGPVGCGDDPFQANWVAVRDTVLLYSLARPELHLPSAFNLLTRAPTRIQDLNATGRWDIAVDTDGDELVLITPGALGIPSRAGILNIGPLNLDDVTEAPTDSAAYVTRDPVDIVVGDIYLVQTDESPGFFGEPCVYYAKLEPLAEDPVAGTLRFVYISSPICNDPSLIPPN